MNLYLFGCISLFLFISVSLLSVENPTVQHLPLLAVGSTNPIKIQAVKEVIKNYYMLESATVQSFSVESDVSKQPMTLEETIRGAKNRAKSAFAACPDCTYGIGIESGFFEAPGTQTGYLETCVCCIFDGNHFHIGLGCCCEIPSELIELIIKNKMDLSEACNHTGLTANPNIGSAEGLLGILTKGRIKRKENTKYCVMMALIQVEQAHLYKQPALTSSLNH